MRLALPVACAAALAVLAALVAAPAEAGPITTTYSITVNNLVPPGGR